MAKLIFLRRTNKDIEVFGGDVYFDLDGKNIGKLAMENQSIKDLYNALESNDKAEIELLYENKCVKPLSELLDESGNAFIKWRYALEDGVSICVNGIIAFAEALQEYSKTIA